MLSSRNEIFLKVKSGYVIPIYTYVFVNHMNKKHMIFMMEPNTDLNPYEDGGLLGKTVSFPFILSNEEFHVLELSHNSK